MAKRPSKRKSAGAESKASPSKKAKAPKKRAASTSSGGITGVQATPQASVSGTFLNLSATGTVMTAAVGDLSAVQDELTVVARGEAPDPRAEVARLRLIVMRELEFVRALPPELVEQLAEIAALRGTGRQSNNAPGVIPDRALTEVIGDASVLASAVRDQLESPKLSKDTFKTFYRTAKEVAEDLEWWSERAKNITGNIADTIGNLTKLVAGVKVFAAAIGTLIGWLG